VKVAVLKNNVPINEVTVETPDVNEMYEIYVGRSEDCHVVIDDPLISRHHFVLKNDHGKWYCEKLTQLGIVSINGLSSTLLEVHEKDEIKCGAYSLLVSEFPMMPSPLNTKPVYTEPAPVYVASSPQPLTEPTPVPVVPNVQSTDDQLDSVEITEEDPEQETETQEGEIQEMDSFSSEESEVTFETPNEESSELSTESFDSGELTSFDEQDTNSDQEEKTSFFKAFVNYQLVLFGDHAPYDRYQIESGEIYIGRDAKKCQIVLDDPEVSSVHAVIKKNAIDIVLEDLNSSNGTILNGERINKAQLQTGDEFVIGSTSFTLETRSDLLEAESGRLMPVESGQTIETEEIEEEIVNMDEGGEVDFNAEGPPEKSLLARFKKDPKFRKKVIYIVAGLGVAYLFLGDSEQPKTPVANSQPQTLEPKEKKDEKPKLQLSKELEEKRNQSYELGVNFFEQNKYFEALTEFQTVSSIDPNYKKVETYLLQTKEGLKRLEELETQRRAEEERIKTKKMIEELLVKAREAVKEKNVQVAENLFSQIAEKDPENIEVQQLKFELESWQKEQERIAMEKAAREATRKAMVDALRPGKTYYLKKEWYKATLKLEDFLQRKGTDEDLMKEAGEMLSDAKNQLASDLAPLVGKARSLKEGQDLKSAYEVYLDILKIEPTNTEALNELDDIRTQLDTRSKRVYREAIIAESLSLFGDAKEKFQEVQQISPTDSDYYRKATEKLKNYLE
jgi:pSer/pThr/pTyr-binding forkhead associated (FHA) protein